MSEAQPASQVAAVTSKPGIEYLSPLTEIAFPTEFYELGDENHFWMQWRLAVAMRLLNASGLAADRALAALDIGGGAGHFRSQLERATQWRVDLTDLNHTALRMASPGRGRTLYYDVTAPHERLLASYDAVFLFDVIEHIQEPGAILGAALQHLRPGGWLFLNVPAVPLLYSAYDVVNGHVRRYSARTLRAELEGLPCRLETVRYWGFSLLPLLALRRLVVGRTPGPHTYKTGFAPPSALANRALRATMRFELALPVRLPLGTSLMLAVQRNQA